MRRVAVVEDWVVVILSSGSFCAVMSCVSFGLERRSLFL